MHKVVLFTLAPGDEGFGRMSSVPLGMLHIGTALRRHGVNVKIHHIVPEQFCNALSNIETDTLFIGVCSILTGGSFKNARIFSRKLKQSFPSIPIIWGGVQPSAVPEICLREQCVDYVCIGEGEELICDFADYLINGGDRSKIPGLAYKELDDRIVVNNPAAIKQELVSIMPDYSLIDLSPYIYEGRIFYILQASRGCPYSCAFCYNSIVSEKKWRVFPTDAIIKQAFELKTKYNISIISFTDDNFWVDKKRAREIMIGCHNIGLRMTHIAIKVNTVSVDDIAIMRDNGVLSVFMGIESMNERILNLINKKQTPDIVIKIINDFAEHAPEIIIRCGFILGYPFQRYSELKQDVKDVVSLLDRNKNVAITLGILAVNPKTVMYKYASINGFSCETFEDCINDDLSNSDMLDRWTLWDMTRRQKKTLKYLSGFATSRLQPLEKSRSGFMPHRFVFSLFRKIVRLRVKYWFFYGLSIDTYAYEAAVNMVEKLRRIIHRKA